VCQDLGHGCRVRLLLPPSIHPPGPSQLFERGLRASDINVQIHVAHGGITVVREHGVDGFRQLGRG
jgi:hypothetical protein